MPSTLLTRRPTPTPTPADERRLCERYACGWVIPCGDGAGGCWYAALRDLSTAAASFVLNCRPPTGAAVAPVLRSRSGQFRLPLPGHVLLSRSHGVEGEWVVVCAFDRQLTEKELLALLS